MLHQKAAIIITIITNTKTHRGMVKSTTARFIHPWFVSNYDKSAKNQTKGAFLFSLNCPVLTIIDNKNVLTAGVKDSNAQLGNETKKRNTNHRPLKTHIGNINQNGFLSNAFQMFQLIIVHSFFV